MGQLVEGPGTKLKLRTDEEELAGGQPVAKIGWAIVGKSFQSMHE
jgi:hypothetical protein